MISIGLIEGCLAGRGGGGGGMLGAGEGDRPLGLLSGLELGDLEGILLNKKVRFILKTFKLCFNVRKDF